MSHAPIGPMVDVPSMPRTRPAFTVPRLSCDCHTHVFGPYSRFPLHAGRTYSPPEAPLEMLAGFLDALHFDRVVVVQPSVYGNDNSATIDAVRRLGNRARGVAVIDPDIDDVELEEMYAAGIRGIRINLMMSDVPSPEVAAALLQRQVRKIKRFGWHVQLFAPMGLLVRMHRTLSSLGVKVVLDHFGWRQPETGADELEGLCALVGSGNVHVKLSAAYRLSHSGFDDPAIAGLARRLIAEHPRALLWGSDWPHPGAFAAGRRSDERAPLHDIDDGLALNSFADWAHDADTIKQILVENPAKLYDFA